MRNFKYDYYIIKIPGDAFDTIEDAGQQAINEARENAKLYCIPANWIATKIKGEIGDFEITFKVRRMRRVNKKQDTRSENEQEQQRRDEKHGLYPQFVDQTN